uniref:Uncharacterized protein n=1 Tax=Cacopsylla melanoneura TaxID=428564 RepID=A0A8D8QY48_9HEMI
MKVVSKSSSMCCMSCGWWCYFYRCIIYYVSECLISLNLFTAYNRFIGFNNTGFACEIRLISFNVRDFIRLRVGIFDLNVIVISFKLFDFDIRNASFNVEIFVFIIDVIKRGIT